MSTNVAAERGIKVGSRVRYRLFKGYAVSNIGTVTEIYGRDGGCVVIGKTAMMVDDVIEVLS